MATKKLFFLFSILLSMVGIKAFAYDIAVENADDMIIYYNYINDGKELEVTSSGETDNRYLGSVVIPEEITYLDITRKVTSIGKRAFQYCIDLTSITIPNSVTTIGDEAFCLCGLTSITIGNSVTSIGEDAFKYCTNLASVTMPNSLTSIGWGAFEGCNGLTSVHISDLESWCKIAFGSSYSNPLNYAHHLFLNGEEIKDLVIPNSVTSVGSYAFIGCFGLTSVTIPNSVTSIGVQAFYYCTGLTTVTIPKSVTRIGSSAFQYCYDLTSIEIPNNVTSIERGTFMYCYSLSSVTIPNGVTSIGSYAFSDCDLNSITIPGSVTSIGSSAFSGRFLPEIISKIEEPFVIDANTFTDNTFLYAKLYVPEGTIDKYKATEGWNKFALIEEVNGSGDTDVDMIKITSAGQTTWCSEYDLDFTNVEGLKAYTATGYHRTKGTIWLTRIKEVPAGEGILLIGDAGDYKVPHLATTAYYANLMVGTLQAITINETDGEYTNYYLSNGAYGVGFYKVDGSVDIKANRAYLPLLKNTVSGSRGFIGIDYDDDAEGTTGISNNNREPITNNVWYNLQGQRVDNPSKGLYIKNGKKFMIK